ncbi:MAG: pyridoxal 5'-phosphate synthase glutaminase subunit PdxT [Fimbriimonadaceae bacterium]|nr:MAG: pyridoxal 5'-phosphate synthase glutaminase subunit PdxT [Fimbriimonadaceae bacterium]
MSNVVGVLAIQGDFHKHTESVIACGHPAEDILEVKTPEDVSKIDRLIIPGGESTTVGLLLERFGTAKAIQGKTSSGMPIWGTCMGMILLAKSVEDRKQFTLSLLDITVRRNAFGAQIHSFEAEVPFSKLDEPILGVFIRAPVVTEFSSEVEVLSKYQDQVVAVQQGKILGTSFHPELTHDIRLHKYFLNL